MERHQGGPSRRMQARWPDLKSVGIGGPRMLARGFESWWPQEKLAVSGYVEVLRHYPEIAGIRPLTDRMMSMEASFDRLAREVQEMKRELSRARSERLEDLTLLVDLITTSWRAVDRRLGRIEQKLERMEGFPEPLGRHGGRPLGARRRGHLPT